MPYHQLTQDTSELAGCGMIPVEHGPLLQSLLRATRRAPVSTCCGCRQQAGSMAAAVLHAGTASKLWNEARALIRTPARRCDWGHRACGIEALPLL